MHRESTTISGSAAEMRAVKPDHVIYGFGASGANVRLLSGTGPVTIASVPR